MNHQHFCPRCLSGGIKGVKNKGGWWNCNKQPCTKSHTSPCIKHAEQAEETERKKKLIPTDRQYRLLD